jgi:hypothetical protein
VSIRERGPSPEARTGRILLRTLKSVKVSKSGFLRENRQNHPIPEKTRESAKEVSTRPPTQPDRADLGRRDPPPFLVGAKSNKVGRSIVVSVKVTE